MVNPEEGTGSLSIDDAVESLMTPAEPEEANPDVEEGKAPEPQIEDAPDPVEDDAEEPEAEDGEEEPESEPEEDDDEPQVASDLYVVKIDGEESKVTLDELKSGYQKDADYRKKTAALADQQREIEQISGHYQAKLNQLVPMLERQAQGKWGSVNWAELAQEDPAEYVVQRQQFEQEMGTLQNAKQEQAFLESQTKEQKQQAFKKRVAEEQVKLVAAMPEMADPKQAKARQGEMADYLRSYEFDDSDINGIADHRFLVIVDKARKFDLAQKSASSAKSKVKAAPKVQKPGTVRNVDPNAGKEKSARARLARSGDPLDAVEVLLSQNQ